ncbi:hypothetical protein OG730_43625 (plasmid) [Streptomyces sp. NBC_01298]|uniref:hypothetical protein n=1 Tax=Streptomyces sp. NBC_01298 TaxID=2903817 RepID=UPI002E1573D6|nr:hypothetical protein OG730_43625 [Streptomyces sp. NBC_01298]
MAETTYRALRAEVQKVAYSVAKEGELIRGIGQRADQNAQRVAQIADDLANLEVDTHTTGEAKDTARIMRGLSQVAIAAASAADTVGGAARAADAQAQKSHEGIDEQVGAMTVPMARAAFYEQE